jgi:DNA-binding NtrC family response regulator
VRILIVEDDADARGFLIGVLRAAGGDVEGFDNLCDAVRAMMREPCDLLLLDLQQPGVPCETALSLLHEVAPGVPVVLTTADPCGRQAARGARAGAFRVVAKPFTAPEILAAVDEARTLRGTAPA